MAKAAAPEVNKVKAPAWIDAPSELFFRESFDGIAPPVSFVKSPLGVTAYYLLEPLSSSRQDKECQPKLPILLLHGVCTPALGMMPIARGLQQHLPNSTILLIDLWGHGLSSSPTAPHTPELAHQQIRGLLDHLGWRSVHIAGYSLGGSLTITFTASHRQRVRSAFLIAPVGMIRDENLEPPITLDDMQERPRETEEEVKSQRRILDWLEGAPTITVPGDWREQTKKGQLVAPALRQWQRDNHKGHNASCASFLRNGNVRGRDDSYRRVAEYGVPTMAVLGENDPIIDGARLDNVGLHHHQVIPNSTHGLARDNTSEVVDAYVNFLSGLQKIAH